MRLIGYGICGPGEADKYLEATLNEFKRIGCDDVIILGNNLGKNSAEEKLIKKFGYKFTVDNSEWGKYQNIIKRNFVSQEVAKLKPDWCVCLDMDEVLDSRFTKASIEELAKIGDAFHFFICDLWNDGWREDSSFWNVRLWQWLPELGFEFKDAPLHCGLAPMWAYKHHYFAPYILKHYGLKEKRIRDLKIARYEKYDPEAKYLDSRYYRMLKSDKSQPFDEVVVMEKITKEVKSYNQTKKKSMFEKKPVEYVVMLRKGGQNGTFEAPKHQIDLYLKQGHTLIGEEKVVTKQIEAPVVEKNPLKCEICGFDAETSTELKAHNKKNHK